MAIKLIDSAKENACRTAEADAIRAKTGGTAPLTYDYANGKGFAEEIAAIPSGGIDSLFTESEIEFAVNKKLATSYNSTLDDYIAAQNSIQASLEISDTTKIYKVDKAGLRDQIAIWGYMPSAEVLMEAHSTITGGTNKDPDAVNYFDSGWFDGDSLIANQYGADYIRVQINAISSVSAAKIKEAGIEDVAKYMMPNGYEVCKIYYPNEIKRGTSGRDTSNPPYYVYTSNTDIVPKFDPFPAGFSYCVINPNGYKVAVHQLTQAGKEAYDVGGSIRDKYVDSGWHENGYEFSATSGEYDMFLVNSAPYCSCGFIAIGRKPAGYDPSEHDNVDYSSFSKAKITNVGSTQGFAVYNNLMFSFDGSSSCKIVSLTNGTVLKTVTGITQGHGNSAQFSNEFLNEGDDFPLLYVSKDQGDPCEVYVYHIERSGNDFTFTLVKTLRWQLSEVGYYANAAYDYENKVMYMFGYTQNNWRSDVGGTNTMYITKWDMNNLVDNGDGTYKPTFISDITTNYFVYAHFGQTFQNGFIWSGSLNTGIIAIDPATGYINTLVHLPVGIGEAEGVSFISNTEMIFGGHNGMWKYTFDRTT